MVSSQDYKCLICSRELGKKIWCVDHDHSCCPGKTSCGKCVRGILCGSCNFAIGIFKDNPAIIRKAADYVENRGKLPFQIH